LRNRAHPPADDATGTFDYPHIVDNVLLECLIVVLIIVAFIIVREP